MDNFHFKFTISSRAFNCIFVALLHVKTPGKITSLSELWEYPLIKNQITIELYSRNVRKLSVYIDMRFH